MTYKLRTMGACTQVIATVAAACLSTVLYSTTALADCSVTSGGGTATFPNSGAVIDCVAAGGAQTSAIGNRETDLTVNLGANAELSAGGRVDIGIGTVTLGDDTLITRPAGVGDATILGQRSGGGSTAVTVILSGENASLVGGAATGGGGIGASGGVALNVAGAGNNADATITLSGDNSSISSHDSGVSAYSYNENGRAIVTLSGDGASISHIGTSGSGVRGGSYYGSASVDVTLGANTSITSASNTAISAYVGNPMIAAVDSSIENSGAITGGGGTAIFLIAGDDTIANNSDGTITGGILTGAGDDTLTNSGTITGDIDLGAGADMATISAGTITGAFEAGADDDTLSLDLDNTVIGASTFFGDEGAGDTGTDTLTLISAGAQAIAADDAAGVYREWNTLNLNGGGDFTLTGTNTDTSTINLNDGSGLIIDTGASFTSDLTAGAEANALTIAGTLTGNVDLGAGENVVTIADGGVLTGDLTTGDDADTLTIAGPTGLLTGNVNLGEGENIITVAGTLDGNLNTGDDFDTLTETGSITGTTDLALQPVAPPPAPPTPPAAPVSDLVIAAGASLSGPVTTDSNVINNGTLNAPLTTSGNFTQNNTGTLSVVIDPDTTTTVSGLNIAGLASLDGTLNVLQLGGTDDRNFATGNMFNVLNADGGVSGEFSLVNFPVTPNADINWQTIYNTSDVTLNILSASLRCGTGGLTSNADEVCGAINEAAASSPELSNVLGVIAGLPESEFQSANDQLSAEGFLGLSTANNRANRAFVGTLRERIGELRIMRPSAGNVGVASLASQALHTPNLSDAVSFSNQRVSGNLTASKLDYNGSEIANALGLSSSQTGVGGTGAAGQGNRSVWVRGFGDVFESETSDPNNTANSQFDATTFGVSVGADQRITPEWIAGVALGYSTTDYETNTNLTGDSDVKQASLYAAYSNKALYGDFMLTYGQIENETNRAVSIGSINENIRGDYDGDLYAARAETGYTFSKDGWEYGPWGSIEYSNTKQDGFTETGSTNGLNLTVNENSTDSLRAVVGGRVAKALPLKELGGVFIPQARVAYQRELLDANLATSASLGGVVTNATGADQPKDTFRIGVGFTHLFDEASNSDSLFGHYETELTRDSTAHRLTAGYRIKF